MNYPSIGQYNQVLERLGENSFSTLEGIKLIPSRLTPIKVYLFGSGAYAAVFKGTMGNRVYALRCFLSAENETIERYRCICRHLATLDASWKVSCVLLDNEIWVEGESFPIVKMEWIDGVLINDFVSQNLNNNAVLTKLQKELVSVSRSLEENQVGHGDLQCGNMIVSGSTSSFRIRLIDYDGMFVPNLSSKISLEKGRSEFQHPRRSLADFGYYMDRFPFWVFLTAIEALKIDKTLWREVMQGGYNTLDNFLFTVQDFLLPDQSKLFNTLYKLDSMELKFYLDNLKSFCQRDFSLTTQPVLFEQNSNIHSTIPSEHHKYIPNVNRVNSSRSSARSDHFKIVTTSTSASVLSSTFKILGTTPLVLDKELYEGKVIVVSNGSEVKRLTLNSDQDLIEIEFS